MHNPYQIHFQMHYKCISKFFYNKNYFHKQFWLVVLPRVCRVSLLHQLNASVSVERARDILGFADVNSEILMHLNLKGQVPPTYPA